MVSVWYDVISKDKDSLLFDCLESFQFGIIFLWILGRVHYEIISQYGVAFEFVI